VFADVEKESGVQIAELFEHFIEDMETYYEELGDWED
jgi:predicted DNA-binding protein